MKGKAVNSMYNNNNNNNNNLKNIRFQVYVRYTQNKNCNQEEVKNG
jgi:hypothetical protein